MNRFVVKMIFLNQEIKLKKKKRNLESSKF